MAEIMPWSLIEEVYAQSMCQDNGRGAIPARVAYGAIFVKEHEDLTGEETVTAIAENPYIQYFLGLMEFTDQPLFDPSMMVHFRKRLMTMMTETIHHHKQASPTRTRQRISSSVIRRTAENSLWMQR